MMREPTSEGRGEDKQKAIGPPVIASRDLLAGHREVIIQHGQSQYRLRLTSSNKLILVK
jgi:hemin uptake protein HemP